MLMGIDFRYDLFCFEMFLCVFGLFLLLDHWLLDFQCRACLGEFFALSQLPGRWLA